MAQFEAFSALETDAEVDFLQVFEKWGALMKGPHSFLTVDPLNQGSLKIRLL